MILKSLLTKASKLSLLDKQSIQLRLLTSQPFFDLELSSKCNINCTICPRTRLERKQELMSQKVMHQLIDWLPKPSKAMMSGFGEPLLNDYIGLLAEGLNKRGIEVGITTNGVLLTHEMIHHLVHCQVNFIQISVNGASEKTYSAIMKGADFSAVMHNLAYLAKVKTDDMTVKLAVTVQSMNENDITNIQKLADQLGFEVFLRHFHSRAGTLYEMDQPSTLSSGCGIFSKVTFIAANGDVLSCCQDLKGACLLGNIFDHTFKQIMLKKKKMIEQNTWFSICTNCDDDYRYHLFFDEIF